jgi:hypothetical protein
MLHHSLEVLLRVVRGWSFPQRVRLMNQAIGATVWITFAFRAP